MKTSIYLQHFICLILTYLAFAFVKADLNPFNWTHDTRAALVWCNVMAQVIVVAIRFSIQNTQQKN